MDRDGNREGGGFNIELRAPFQHFMLHKVFHLKCTTLEDCTAIKLWLNTQLTLFANESTASDFVMTSVLYLNAKKKS